MDLQRGKGGVYCLRRAVPEDLQGTFGRREIVRSLGTRELPVARRRAERLRLELDREFDQARSHARAELSVEEAKRLAEQCYRGWLAEDAMRRFGGLPGSDAGSLDPSLLEELMAKAQCALANADYCHVSDTVLDLLRTAGLAADPHSSSFKRLAHWLLRYQVKYYEQVDERDAGNWSGRERFYMGGYVPRPLEFETSASKSGEQVPQERTQSSASGAGRKSARPIASST